MTASAPAISRLANAMAREILEVHRHGAATAAEKPMLLVEAFHSFAPPMGDGLTRKTSAPVSEKSIEANGPGPMPPSSTILSPASGPASASSVSGFEKPKRVGNLALR